MATLGSLVARQAALAPQHIQLNLSTLAVELVNTSNFVIENYLATVRAVTPAGESIWGFNVPVSKALSHSASVILQRLPSISNETDVVFLELGLRNEVRRFL